MITLDDVVADTEFKSLSDFVAYKKGSTVRGFGPTGETLCYPKLGGKFQTSDKLAVWINNNSEILL